MTGQAKRGGDGPWLLGIGGVLAGSALGIALLGDLRLRIGAFLALWFAAHAAYLGAAWRVTRPPASDGNALTGRARSPYTGLALVLAVGLLVRLILLPTQPSLSEDVYRYLWDGRLAAAGVNPFPHPPSDPALARFHDGLLEKLNHADVPTVYPPTAQGLFALAALAGGSTLAWKIVLLVTEGILLAALVAILGRRGLNARRILLYYWNPLVWVESFASGHVDLAAAAFLVLAIALAESRRFAAAGVSLGLAIQAKYFPLLVVPYFARRRAWLLLVVASATAALALMPFAGAGAKLLAGLHAYAMRWEFNGSVYPLARALYDDAEGVRLLLLAALAALAITAGARAHAAETAAAGVLLAYVLLSPTVHPWYLVPLVALLPLVPRASVMVLSALTGLAYLTLPGYVAAGVWSLPAWVPWVEYGGFAGVAIFEEMGRRRYEREPPWQRESTPT